MNCLELKYKVGSVCVSVAYKIRLYLPCVKSLCKLCILSEACCCRLCVWLEGEANGGVSSPLSVRGCWGLDDCRTGIDVLAVALRRLGKGGVSARRSSDDFGWFVGGRDFDACLVGTGILACVCNGGVSALGSTGAPGLGCLPEGLALVLATV